MVDDPRRAMAAARAAGRFVGALLDCGVDLCPWTQTSRRDLRNAWLVGFEEGRIARIRLADIEAPAIEITLAALGRTIDE